MTLGGLTWLNERAVDYLRFTLSFRDIEEIKEGQS
jgi:hypothetical protein